MPLRGKLSIVGIGPGSPDQMTVRAWQAIREAEYVIGNDAYLKQIQSLLEEKEVVVSRMGEEVDRAKRAVSLARDRLVVMVSGGDSGIYGMASIVLEVLEREGVQVTWEIVPGVTAANAAASLLGAPLSGDFAAISLSDLLTPIDIIEHRLEHAFAMGVPIALYNPKSRGRPHNLAIAIGIARKHLPPGTPLGVVRDAYRDGETVVVTTLGDFESVEEEVDMHAIVLVGTIESRIIAMEGRHGIITPRGYHRKYVY